MNDAGLALIKRFEGIRLAPYLCPALVWTIGYGATYDAQGDRVSRSTPALADEAEAGWLLQRDVARVERAVDRLVTIPVNDNQRAALTSFAFNLGPGALRASTLLKRVNNGEWADVPHQFARWVNAGGRRLPGLVRRRAAEAALWKAPAARTPDTPYLTAPQVVSGRPREFA